MDDAVASAEGRQAFSDRIRTWSAEQGKPAGLDLAEGFKLLRP
jgi:hypothetical protein